MTKSPIFNLRPYSWIDLILLGFLAKFSISRSLNFAFSDLYFISSLLLLWFFFNFILEVKHNYSYRSKISLYLPIISLISAIFIGLSKNVYSLIPLVFSVFLVLVYLQKNRNTVLGNFSSITRGLIESSYFIFAVLLLSNSVDRIQIIISIFIFLIYTARALIGDMRDLKHNKEAHKKTFPVTFGMNACKGFMIFLLLITLLLQILIFDSYLISVPLALFAITLLFYNNGYVLHQLFVLTSSFFSLNLIYYFTNQNLIIINLIYLGILLNFIFYPLLQRKSNPKFV